MLFSRRFEYENIIEDDEDQQMEFRRIKNFNQIALSKSGTIHQQQLESFPIQKLGDSEQSFLNFTSYDELINPINQSEGLVQKEFERKDLESTINENQKSDLIINQYDKMLLETKLSQINNPMIINENDIYNQYPELDKNKEEYKEFYYDYQETPINNPVSNADEKQQSYIQELNEQEYLEKKNKEQEQNQQQKNNESHQNNSSDIEKSTPDISMNKDQKFSSNEKKVSLDKDVQYFHDLNEKNTESTILPDHLSEDPKKMILKQTIIPLIFVVLLNEALMYKILF